jgi:hypothetical protein
MTRRILKAGESYPFSRYFELPFTLEDILLELDCTLCRTPISLPTTHTIPALENLRQQLERNLRRTNLLNESTRREALISPVLLEVCDLADQTLNIEYAISVNDYLKGTLDYYIAASNLLVIEAKQSDLVRGFTQLAVELVALDQWMRSDTPQIYGAVTTGEVWKFGVFDRTSRQVLEDRHLYPLLPQPEPLVRILLGILQAEK